MRFRVRHTLRNGLALCGETRGARVQHGWWRHCRRCAVRLNSEETARRRKADVAAEVERISTELGLPKPDEK